MTQKSTTDTPGTAGAEGYAWIDGKYVPISQARISILDTGFVRSDVTYDVVGAWEGKLFRLDEHLERFQRGCRAMRLELPMSRDGIREIVVEVVARSGLRNAYVEMIGSRGVPAPGVRDPRELTARFYAYAVPYVWIVAPELGDSGTDIVVARDVRRIPPGAIDPTIKNFQWGDFMRGLFEAYDRGAWLPVLTDGDGKLTEGPGFNVFLVKGHRVQTPAHGVLHGITRQTVLEIAREEELSVEVSDVRTSAIYDADEIFLTSTAGGVMPVATVDGGRVGHQCPGPVTRRIREKYWAKHDDPRFATPVEYRELAARSGSAGVAEEQAASAVRP